MVLQSEVCSVDLAGQLAGCGWLVTLVRLGICCKFCKFSLPLRSVLCFAHNNFDILTHTSTMPPRTRGKHTKKTSPDAPPSAAAIQQTLVPLNPAPAAPPPSTLSPLPDKAVVDSGAMQTNAETFALDPHLWLILMMIQATQKRSDTSGPPQKRQG
jgi:hypothetical protein